MRRSMPKVRRGMHLAMPATGPSDHVPLTMNLLSLRLHTLSASSWLQSVLLIHARITTTMHLLCTG